MTNRVAVAIVMTRNREVLRGRHHIAFDKSTAGRGEPPQRCVDVVPTRRIEDVVESGDRMETGRGRHIPNADDTILRVV
jgi:hypothetical protein